MTSNFKTWLLSGQSSFSGLGLKGLGEKDEDEQEYE